MMTIADLDFDVKHDRKCNIVIRGIAFNTTNLKREVEELFRNKMKVKVNVVEARELKSRNLTNNAQNAGTLVIMRTFDDKFSVMKNRRLLKGTAIFVDHDMSYEEREIDIKIKDRAQEEISKGHRVTRGFMTLTVNGKLWKWSSDQKKLVESNARN